MSEQLLELEGEHIRALIRPEKGCDILGLVDLATGIDVLWRAPWGLRELKTPGHGASSRDYWVKNNGGGWNLLLPNAGPERVVNNMRWGFHGEAAVVPWTVERSDGSSASLTVTLLSAPLQLRRELRVVGNRLYLDESVTNTSSESIPLRWGHHPTYGAPFIAPGVRIEVDATDVEEDIDSADGCSRRGVWPELDGNDLSVVASGRRSLLAYLSGFSGQRGRYRIVNDELDLAVTVEWPLEVFPYLWLWEELNATTVPPWHGAGYALALEPHSTIPSAPSQFRTIAAGATQSARLTATINRAR